MVTVEAGQHDHTREQLTGFIVEGNTLFDERFDALGKFSGWLKRYEAWEADVNSWMAQNESFSVAFRFRRLDQEGPQIQYRHTSGDLHNRQLNRLRAGLMFLGSI